MYRVKRNDESTVPCGAPDPPVRRLTLQTHKLKKKQCISECMYLFSWDMMCSCVLECICLNQGVSERDFHSMIRAFLSGSIIVQFL